MKIPFVFCRVSLLFTLKNYELYNQEIFTLPTTLIHDRDEYVRTYVVHKCIHTHHTLMLYIICMYWVRLKGSYAVT